ASLGPNQNGNGATIPPPVLALPTPIGLTTGSAAALSIASNPMQPVLAATAPGVITGVTPNVPQPMVIPPPQLVTTLPLSLHHNPELAAPSKFLSTPPVTVANNSNNTNSVGAVATGAMGTAAAALAAKELELKLSEANSNVDESQTLQQQENIVIKGSNARQMLMHKLMRKNESRVIVLRNMIGIEDLDDELEQEVTEECGKFGFVNRVIIYQERQSEEDDADIVVKIFVEFSQQSEAIKGRDALNGRFFGGRTVKAELYDQILYEDNDLSG
ncbi:unnamed protein product, partial [Oppiella nova]